MAEAQAPAPAPADDKKADAKAAAEPDKKGAKGEEKKADKKDDKKDDKKGEKKDAKAGGKKNPIVMIAILGGAVLALTAGSYFLVVKMTAPADAGSGEKPKAEAKKKEGKVLTFEVRDLVLNPADTGVTHFAKISLVFETSDPKLLPELEERQYRVRDLLIRLIGKRTASELSNADVREDLRAQILDELNSTVADGAINDVFFTDFIIQ
jgi:flagellar basal body-associated protein FliL